MAALHKRDIPESNFGLREHAVGLWTLHILECLEHGKPFSFSRQLCVSYTARTQYIFLNMFTGKWLPFLFAEVQY